MLPAKEKAGVCEDFSVSRTNKSVAASYSHTQVQSVVDSVRVAESMRERAAAGQPMDAMAALEAEANASISADAAAADKGGSARVKMGPYSVLLLLLLLQRNVGLYVREQCILGCMHLSICIRRTASIF
eukprot:1161160-Pelagomonas_calceolata.AAC.3